MRRKGFEPLTPKFEVWSSVPLSCRRVEPAPFQRADAVLPGGDPQDVRVPLLVDGATEITCTVTTAALPGTETGDTKYRGGPTANAVESWQVSL